MREKFSVSVILPVYNEEGNIAKVIRESADFLGSEQMALDYEIIAVNDGSQDNTGGILKKLTNEIPGLKIVTHHKNLGYGKALLSGLGNSIYPLVFFMDADGQFDISDIKKLFAYIGEYSVITGYRNKREDAFFRVILGKFYSWLVSLLFGIKLKDVNCGFKLFRREVLADENICSNGGVFYLDALLKAVKKGHRIKEIPVRHFQRLSGKESGASAKVIINALADLFKLKVYLSQKT